MHLHRPPRAKPWLRHLPLAVSLAAGIGLAIWLSSLFSADDILISPPRQLLEMFQSQCASAGSLGRGPDACSGYANATGIVICTAGMMAVMSVMLALASLVGSLPFGANSQLRDILSNIALLALAAFLLLAIVSGIAVLEVFKLHLFIP